MLTVLQITKHYCDKWRHLFYMYEVCSEDPASTCEHPSFFLGLVFAITEKSQLRLCVELIYN